MESLRKRRKCDASLNAMSADPDVEMLDTIYKQYVVFLLLLPLYLLLLTQIAQKSPTSIS